MKSLVAALATACALGASSCAHAPPAPAIVLRVDCNVADATVWIDDVLAGSAAAWKRGDQRIRPGFHRVEVRSPGYYPVFQEIDLPDGGAAVVAAKLRPTLD